MLLSFVLADLFVCAAVIIYFVFFRYNWCMSRFLLSVYSVGLNTGASGLGENVSVDGGGVEWVTVVVVGCCWFDCFCFDCCCFGIGLSSKNLAVDGWWWW